MKNRFFTILIIPEKSAQVRRFVIPNWLAKSLILGASLAVILSAIMVFDYWYIISQIGEYRELKIENRRLQQQVQTFKSKMTALEDTVDRVKTFSTRLKVITNLQDKNNLLESLNQKLPDASTNIVNALEPKTLTSEDELASVETEKDFLAMDTRSADLLKTSSLMEQTLQDQYELLVDKKDFLLALPSRKPSPGQFTSGFGVRRSPYGGKEKMHEGLDIANNPGTQIYAPADGTVIFADLKPGYGKTLILDHGYGLETWYAHTQKIVAKRGQKIHRGELIALLGNTGRSTGPHLHYEVRVYGTPVDPLTYILEN